MPYAIVDEAVPRARAPARRPWPERRRCAVLSGENFDEQALGWPYQAVASPDAVPPADRSLVYDTTRWSQSNAGHTFGDHLSATERRAVIEYLKTL